jgi:hypothetical protein
LAQEVASGPRLGRTDGAIPLDCCRHFGVVSTLEFVHCFDGMDR